MRLYAPLASAILVSGGLLSGACAPKPDELPPSVKSMLNATAVISACPDNKRMNGKLAFEAVNRLVEPCAQVPGGKAHFAATLLPGGKIELASPEGNVAEGVVPTCVLRHGLTHRVLLTHRCTFDVQLEERKAGAPSGS
jgi:hypothetical protein